MIPFKNSCVSKSQFTHSVAESHVFNKEYDDVMDVGYQASLKRGQHDLPYGAHFCKTEKCHQLHLFAAVTDSMANRMEQSFQRQNNAFKDEM